MSTRQQMEQFLALLDLPSTKHIYLGEHDLWLAELGALFRKYTRSIPILALYAGSGEKLLPTLLEDVNATLGRAGVPGQILALILDFGDSLSGSKGVPSNWLVLEGKECQGLVNSSRPRKHLSRLIRVRARLKELCPYQTKHYVFDRMFFGRTEQVTDILRWASPNFAILGPRRIGKSSLARAIERALRVQRKNMIELSRSRYADPVAYIDCNLLANFTESDFFQKILESMGLETRDTYNTKKLLGRQERFLTPFEILERLTRQKYLGITIVIDEVDGLLQADRKLNWPIFRKIQGLIDRVPESTKGSPTADRPAIVLSGFTELNRCLYEQSFPLFGRVKAVVLGNLGHGAIESLVLDPMRELGIKIAQSEDVVNRIIFHTGGMPSVVQSLCAQAIDLLEDVSPPVLTPELVEKIIGTQAPLTDYLNWFDFNATPREKMLVHYAAPVGRFSKTSFKAFCAKNRLANFFLTEIAPALDSLAFANIFREVQRYELYDFSVEAFRTVIEARVKKHGDPVSALKELLRQ